MTYDEIISELGKNIGINDLCFSNEDNCSVIFDKKDEIVFEKSDGRMFMIANLGASQGKEDVYRMLLEGNYLGKFSAFGSIGINTDLEEFTLTRVFEGELDYREFEQSLAFFIVSMRKLKDLIIKGNDHQNIGRASLFSSVKKNMV
jgi:hypothetical protein